ncbi:MAG: toxin-antitoxin system YwqK family antitoxin, partial [Planctomycetota bacterium]
MAETSGGNRTDPGPARPDRRAGVFLDWAFRVVLGLCALPALASTVIVVQYFAHDSSALPKVLLGVLPVPLACAVLILPWRILLKNRATKAVTLLAACVVAHRLYASSGMFKALAHSQGLFVLCGVILATGVASLVLYTRHIRRKMWPVALGTALVLICFVFGAGDPQWSRFIFIWQVHYSPWKQDAANLPTNRGDVRAVLPKYTEWDARGRRVREWTHPDGELLRTEFYPDGRKRMERLYGEDQFVTSWYPDGQMEYHYDRQTRRRRAWDPNGTPRDGEVRETLPGSHGARTVRQYEDG